MLPNRGGAEHTSKGFVRLTEGMGTARGSGLAGGTEVLLAPVIEVFARLLAAGEEVLVGGA
jgi:hypothetical protein